MKAVLCRIREAVWWRADNTGKEVRAASGVGSEVDSGEGVWGRAEGKVLRREAMADLMEVVSRARVLGRGSARGVERAMSRAAESSETVV